MTDEEELKVFIESSGARVEISKDKIAKSEERIKALIKERDKII